MPPPSSAANRRTHQLEAEIAALRRTVANNVSAERLATLEHTLQQRDHDLRAILDHMPAMVGYWDRNLRNRFGNHAYQTWFGIDPARLPGMHIREVIGEERFRLNLPYIEAALRGEAQQFERAIPTPDGTRLRHSLASYIPDHRNGEVCGFFVLVTDITVVKETEARLRQREEQLRASEERYRGVVEDQTEIISRLTADGRYVFVNEVYCRFFGKTAAELLGHQWMPVCHPDDLPEVQSRLATLSPEQPVVTIENRIYSGSGEVRWMQFVNRGFFDPAGQLLEIQSVGRDIDDRKRAEAALAEVHAQLEQRVIERTGQLRRLVAELTLTEEREQRALARDLHDGLGQLLHVLRIKVDALDTKLPPDAHGALAELQTLLAEGSHQIRTLTSQLCPPVLHKLGLLAALQWLGDEMRQHYDLQVDFQHDEILPPVDTVQAEILFRTVRELLINVRKHSGQQHARLTLHRAADSLRLTVEDDGIGIANAEQARKPGDGFGLTSICERITYLGGHIAITAGPRGGLSVSIVLPLTALDQLPEKP